MKKFLTDIHTHSKYSFDGQNELAEMLETARAKGLDFYGVAEHFEYDLLCLPKLPRELIDAEKYFHGARHLQEDYEGVMNVAVGAEYGYSEKAEVQGRYAASYEKHHPDFVINSVHSINGVDYYYHVEEGEKGELYRSYLRLIRKSLDVPYHYDIVGHIGYIARYVPYEDRSFNLQQFGAEIDDILKTIIQKDKILEVNSSTKQLPQLCMPDVNILQRYYVLGGRKVSFGSDAHDTSRILEKREVLVLALKQIGFTYLTVPFKGEHIKVEI
jgi:histidinol-phosphatase (PHP family)